MPSFSSHILVGIIRLKRLKKAWMTAPVDYRKRRLDNVHHPPHQLTRGLEVSGFQIADTSVTEIRQPGSTTGPLVIYIHGGAFISGPKLRHWQALARLVRHTGATAWMVDYPKAPESGIRRINDNVDAVYEKALEIHGGQRILLMGDSAGGTLILTLVHRLIAAGNTLPDAVLPITPVADASLTNPKIAETEDQDPILSREGILWAKKSCAGDMDLKDPGISPLYGDFHNGPPVYLFTGTRDILYPDQEALALKLKAQHVPLHYHEYPGMLHVWPLLPFMKESRTAWKDIEQIVRAYGN